MTGPYRHVRHPLQLAEMALVWAGVLVDWSSTSFFYALAFCACRLWLRGAAVGPAPADLSPCPAALERPQALASTPGGDRAPQRAGAPDCIAFSRAARWASLADRSSR